MIWKRFLASQMSAAIFDATTIDVKANDCIFRATGSVIKFPGFLSVYEEFTAEESQDKEEGKNVILPIMKKNEMLDCQKLEPRQHYTKPPPRFTQASLVKELEADGIGRPSTYATIISTLQEREYIDLQGRNFHPTDKGKVVNKILVSQFPELFNVEFTAKMEENLDKIETGSLEWVKMVHDFYLPFRSQLDKAEKETREIKQALQEETGEKCPNCGQDLVVKWGKHGKFLACKGFPNCKYTRPLEEETQQQLVETKCSKCGSPMLIRKGKFGRFLACSAYPECQNIQPVSTGVKCPEKDCGGELVEKQSKKGKVFYSCSNYPKCKFASWNRPIAEPCPYCNNSYIEEKVSKTGQKTIACPACNKRINLKAAENHVDAE